MVSSAFGTDFSAGIGRRDGFGATTGREAISAQDICFLGVAGGVPGSEVFGAVSDEVESGGVAGGVGNAATALDVSIGAMGVRSAANAFGVEGGVGIAATGFGVGTAVSLEVSFAFDARRSLMVTTQGHVGEYSQCFRYAFSFGLNP